MGGVGLTASTVVYQRIAKRSAGAVEHALLALFPSGHGIRLAHALVRPPTSPVGARAGYHGSITPERWTAMLPFALAVPALILPVVAVALGRPSARTLGLVAAGYLFVAASLLSVIWANATFDASTVLDTAEGWLFVATGLFVWVTLFSGAAVVRFLRRRRGA